MAFSIAFFFVKFFCCLKESLKIAIFKNKITILITLNRIYVHKKIQVNGAGSLILNLCLQPIGIKWVKIMTLLLLLLYAFIN